MSLLGILAGAVGGALGASVVKANMHKELDLSIKSIKEDPKYDIVHVGLDKYNEER